MTTVESDPVGGVGSASAQPIDLRRRLSGAEGPRFRRAVAIAFGVFVISRLCMVAATAVRAAQLTVDANVADEDPPGGALGMMVGVLGAWDGEWYMSIVRTGYPGYVPPDITFFQLEARAAFFPVFPFVVRVVQDVIGVVVDIDATYVALAVNTVMAVAAMILIGLIALRLFDVEVARRTMILFVIFPGSFVLTYAYAEPIFLVVAMACLLMLMDERWILAGVFAAVGTATRPNGVALVAACAVASFLAVRRRRDWSSLAAPLLAPLGIAAFHLYLTFHTGEWQVWFRVQNEAWEEGTSFGRTAVTNTLDFVRDPFTSPTNAITALTFLCMIAALLCLRKRPLPAPFVAYIVAILALMLIPATVTARPRFLYTAFPLLIAVGAWWPRRDRTGWELAMLGCGAGLTALTGLYAVYGAIP